MALEKQKKVQTFEDRVTDLIFIRMIQKRSIAELFIHTKCFRVYFVMIRWPYDATAGQFQLILAYHTLPCSIKYGWNVTASQVKISKKNLVQ